MRGSSLNFTQTVSISLSLSLTLTSKSVILHTLVTTNMYLFINLQFKLLKLLNLTATV